jgi:4-aminobutyrate aminotransferase
MTNSGTEAVEAAIKLARYYTGCPCFLGFYGAFHGRPMGALAFTASRRVQRDGFSPMLRGVTHIPYPDPYRLFLQEQGAQEAGEAVITYLEQTVLAQALPPEDVAAVLVEPVYGEGGYIIPPDSFLPRLREVCNRHSILLIVDEVQSGMGRTGKMWPVQHVGVEPDIVCSAKGIASGMPLGAMVACQSIMTWPRGAHGSTYAGNPPDLRRGTRHHPPDREWLDGERRPAGDVPPGGVGRDATPPPQHRPRARSKVDDRRRVSAGSGHERASHRLV